MSLQALRVSPNRRHLITADGRPFFWLADTAWTLFCHLKHDEARHYFENRRDKGFNVVQMVVLDPETNAAMTNAYGIAPFRNSPQPGDALDFNPAFFDYLEELIDIAAEMGIYIALLPTWGELVVGWTWGEGGTGKLINVENGRALGYSLGHRLRDKTNIIWVLGGDRHPVFGADDYRPVWRAMAEGIAAGITGQSPKWDEAHPAWDEVLITYHTCNTDSPEIYSSSHWLDASEKWLSFHMIQSGHREQVESYNQIAADYALTPPRPVLDAEPNYEDWRHGGANGGFHRAWNVRKRAYWSLLAGACGHTYGHVSVWCMLDPSREIKPGELSWRGALDRPGAEHMRHLRQLVESRPFFDSKPDQSLLLANAWVAGTMDTRRQARLDREGHFAFIYTTSGGAISVDLSRFTGEIVKVWWFDPRTGRVCDPYGAPVNAPFARLPAKGVHRFQPPTHGPNQDWLLVLDSAAYDFPIPGQTIHSHEGN